MAPRLPAPPAQASPRKAGTCCPPRRPSPPNHSLSPTSEGRKGRTGVVSLSVLCRSWPPRSHSHFLVLINKRGEVEGAGRSEGRGGEGRGGVGGDKMASSKSGAGERSRGVEARRESRGPAGYAGACPPLRPRRGAASASRLCPWTLAPARTSRGGCRFIAGVCLRCPPPAPGLLPGGE